MLLGTEKGRVPPQNNRPSILLIEDDKLLVESLRDLFVSNGYRVQSASNGLDGLAVARENKPDLIILDVNLPIMHGLDVLAGLRRHPETVQVPVIFLSGLPSDLLFKAVSSTSRAAYLRKPVDWTDLLSMVREFYARYAVAR